MAYLSGRRPLPALGKLLSFVLNSRASLFLFAAVICTVGLFAHQHHLVFSSLLLTLLAGFWKETNQILKVFDRLSVPSQVLLIGAVTLMGVVHFCVFPAEAVFLDKACGLLSDVFSSANASVDPVQITINIIRAMFILYLAIALIQVFNAMRHEEDWQTAVRAPVLAVLLIVIVDVISSLVTTGTTTC